MASTKNHKYLPWYQRRYVLRSMGGRNRSQAVIGVPSDIATMRLGREYTWKVRANGVLELHPVEESGEQRHEHSDPSD